jgi:hypothetical protein
MGWPSCFSGTYPIHFTRNSSTVHSESSSQLCEAVDSDVAAVAVSSFHSHSKARKAGLGNFVR